MPLSNTGLLKPQGGRVPVTKLEAPPNPSHKSRPRRKIVLIWNDKKIMLP